MLWSRSSAEAGPDLSTWATVPGATAKVEPSSFAVRQYVDIAGARRTTMVPPTRNICTDGANAEEMEQGRSAWKTEFSVSPAPSMNQSTTPQKYAWVLMDAFEGPVVPEVRSRQCGSDGSTTGEGGTARSAALHKDAGSIRRCAQCGDRFCASASSATTTVGSIRSQALVSICPRYAGLTGAITAPSRVAPHQVRIQPGPLDSRIITRSPGPTPWAASTAAALRPASRLSCHVHVTPPSNFTSGRSGQVATPRRRSSRMVSDSGMWGPPGAMASSEPTAFSTVDCG